MTFEDIEKVLSKNKDQKFIAALKAYLYANKILDRTPEEAFEKFIKFFYSTSVKDS